MANGFALNHANLQIYFFYVFASQKKIDFRKDVESEYFIWEIRTEMK